MRMQNQRGFILTGTLALATLGGCAGAGVGTPNSSLAQTGAASGAFNQSARASASGFLNQSINFDVARSASVLRPDLQRIIRNTSGLKNVPPPSPCPSSGARGFVSDANGNVVYKLRTNPLAVCGTPIAGPALLEPQGLATDQQGNLYIANTGASNVLRYTPPYSGPPTVLNDPNEYPVDVAVDAAGNVAVTNMITTSGGPGNVVLYAANSLVPTGSAQSLAFPKPYFAAFKANGDLVLDDLENNGTVNVGVIVGPHFHMNNNSISTMTTNNTIGFPGGVQVNTVGKVAILDQSTSTIYTYNASSGFSLGSPSPTTLPNSGTLVSFAFNATGTYTLTADAGSSAALVNQYPSGTPHATAPVGITPIGAAWRPSEQY